MINTTQPINLSDILMVLGFAGTVIGLGWRMLAVFAARFAQIEARHAAEARRLQEDFAARIAALLSEIAAIRADIEALRTAIAEHKLEVARNYVSRDSLRELEERLVAAIERLGDRLDRVLDRRSKPRGGVES